VAEVIKIGGKNGPKLEAAAITGFYPDQWNAGTLLTAGINEGKAGKLLSVFGEHHYAVSLKGFTNVGVAN
jgi:hypothetical protein